MKTKHAHFRQLFAYIPRPLELVRRRCRVYCTGLETTSSMRYFAGIWWKRISLNTLFARLSLKIKRNRFLITYANYSCSQKKSWLIIKDEEIVMSPSHLKVCNHASTSRLALLSLISLGDNLALNDHRHSQVINSIAIKVSIRLMTLPDLLTSSIRNNIRSNFSPAIYVRVENHLKTAS